MLQKVKKISLFLGSTVILASCSQNPLNVPVNNLSGSSFSNSYSDSSSVANSAPVVSNNTENTSTLKFAPSDNTSATALDVAPISNSNSSSVALAASCTARNAYNFRIPRDAAGTPIYSQMTKGGYTGAAYVVQPKDSLYLISYISGIAQAEILRLNNLRTGDSINPGKLLVLRPSKCNSASQVVDLPVTTSYPVPTDSVATAANTAKTTVNNATTAATNALNSATTNAKSVIPSLTATAAASTPVVVPKESSTIKIEEVNSPEALATAKTAVNNSKNVVTKGTEKLTALNVQGQATGSGAFAWPAKGKVIEAFSGSEASSHGIVISGNLGDKIYAAVDGRVTYAGNDLEGYGLAVIVKSSNGFLTLYAHNSKVLVKMGDNIKKGQVIALMGNSAARSTRLYFEVRKDGKAVDPLKYLAKR